MRGWRRTVVVAAAAVAGLLLLLAWANSYRRFERIEWTKTDRSSSIHASRGQIALRHVWLIGADGAARFGDIGWRHESSHALPLNRAQNESSCDIYCAVGPFSFLRGSSSPTGISDVSWRLSALELIVPFWFVALIATAVFALLIRLTRPRSMPGCCVTCGYDLRASPDRCPECGAVA